MNTEFADNRVSQSLIAEPDEASESESDNQDKEPGSRNITWTLSCLDGKIDPKAYERLKSEINWVEVTDEGAMIFRSTEATEIDALSKKIRAIFAENEEANIVREFLFTIGPH